MLNGKENSWLLRIHHSAGEKILRHLSPPPLCIHSCSRRVEEKTVLPQCGTFVIARSDMCAGLVLLSQWLRPPNHGLAQSINMRPRGWVWVRGRRTGLDFDWKIWGFHYKIGNDKIQFGCSREEWERENVRETVVSEFSRRKATTILNPMTVYRVVDTPRRDESKYTISHKNGWNFGKLQLDSRFVALRTEMPDNGKEIDVTASHIPLQTGFSSLPYTYCKPCNMYGDDE